MTQAEKRAPTDRLNYSGSLNPIIKRASVAFEIGEIRDFSIIEIGYEDCNIKVETEKGKFLAKLFQRGRTSEEIARYATTMDRVVAAGVNHPPLIKLPNKQTVWADSEVNGLQMVLMRFIDGQTFFEMDRSPNPNELTFIAEQASKINKMDYKPPYIFDSWAIPNIQLMFDKTKQYFTPEDLRLVQTAMIRYKTIPVDSLPHCFVHGDFTKTNILKGADELVYILDFSVANWYPRIQELAVIAANLMHNDQESTSLDERTKIVAKEYNVYNQLLDEETKWLYDYALAGIAMEFMGAHQEKYINRNDTEETNYWLSLGRDGLQRELA